MLASRWESSYCVCLLHCKSKRPLWRAFWQSPVKLKIGILCDSALQVFVLFQFFVDWIVSSSRPQEMVYLQNPCLSDTPVVCTLPVRICCLNDTRYRIFQSRPLSRKTFRCCFSFQINIPEKVSSQFNSFSLCGRFNPFSVKPIRIFPQLFHQQHLC